tara:strand:- start:5227 stop:5613 length:387 start_codon:yes stop_codon:yes gene_type:complete
MSEATPTQPTKAITNVDLVGGATLSSFVVYVLTTWTQNVSAESALQLYINEQTIPFIAGALTCITTKLWSFIGYAARFKLYDMSYSKKLSFINKVLSNTTCPIQRADLEKKKHELNLSTISKVISEKP